jgi:hypothetical protein
MCLKVLALFVASASAQMKIAKSAINTTLICKPSRGDMLVRYENIDVSAATNSAYLGQTS